jgi:hypothetical protein
MKRNDVLARHNLLRAFGTLSLVAMLAACGGGSDAPAPSNNNVSADGAKNAAANSTAIPNDSATALSAIITATEAVVAAGSASVTIACPGGGTAVYMVTGPNAALLLNHQLDQGENYSLVFNACRSANGAATVNGAVTLNVTAKTADTITLDTAHNNVVVSLPHGDLMLNGASTLTRTIQTVGNMQTITTHWVTPNFSVVSHRNGRTTSFTYSNVDITRTVVLTNGQFTSASYNGTSTLSWGWPGGSFSVTFATQGTVGCAEDGTPTQGTITITLPNDRITISVVPGTVTVTVDFGKDGIIDRTYVFTVTDIVNSGG